MDVYTTTANSTSNPEEASPLEGLYEGQVADWCNKRWFTISPDSRPFKDRQEQINTWIHRMHKWLYHSCSDYIFVLELADERPHFHGVANVKDFTTFGNKYWELKKDNNCRIHDKFTKNGGGLKYMFKDVENTYNSTQTVPVMERGDFSIYLEQKKEQRRINSLARKQAQLDELEKEYPRWMLEGI